MSLHSARARRAYFGDLAPDWSGSVSAKTRAVEVVPGLVELEVAVPRLKPAVR
jgi:hypothetical protein